MSAQCNLVVGKPALEVHVAHHTHTGDDEALIFDGRLEPLLTIPYISVRLCDSQPSKLDVQVILRGQGRVSGAFKIPHILNFSAMFAHFCMIALVLLKSTRNQLFSVYV